MHNHRMTASNVGTPVVVGIGPVSADDVVRVARDDAPVVIAETPSAITASRGRIEALADDPTPAYGISTGFGALATRHIPHELRTKLQRSLIRSHAAGSGPEVEREVVRAMMLLRLSTLATGRTGVRPEVAQAYAAMLSAGLTPVVYEYGSLGCSGDLAPLAHVALAIIGEGHVRTADGDLLPAADALAAHGIEPVVLAEKEGLALINGTDGMLGQLILALADLDRLLRARRRRRGDERRRPARHGPGLRAAPAGPATTARPGRRCREHGASARRLPHRREPQRAGLHPGPGRVLAAVRTASRRRRARHRRACPQRRELGIGERHRQSRWSPSTGTVESNGNFHGAPVAYVLDFLAIVVADLASISERRTDRFLDVARSHGLNPFLADDPGVDSGHMIAQYTQAAIVSELKRLASPASVDSIPSSAMQEDHVSMGWSAARKLRKAIDGLTRVLAIEVLTAARGIDMRAPLAPSPATGAVIAAMRTASPSGPARDRYLAPEIEAVVELARDGSLWPRPSRSPARSLPRTTTGVVVDESSDVVEYRLGHRDVAAQIAVFVVARQHARQRQRVADDPAEPASSSPR